MVSFSHIGREVFILRHADTVLSNTRITNGVWSHYCTMAVRTGAPGAGGLSLLVVPLLGQEGVSMRRMKTTGSTSSGTTYIELDDVKVPVENLIGRVCIPATP